MRKGNFFTDSSGPILIVTSPLNVPAELAVAEKPGPLLVVEVMSQQLEEPDPELDADVYMLLPEPEEVAVADRSL